MADLLTLDIVNAVRGKLSDTAFDQELIIDALNFFVAEIYHNTRTRRMESSDQISAAAGDTVADFPDDIDTRINMTVTSPSVYDLTKLYWEYGDFMRAFPKWQTDVPKALQQWTDFGNQMRFSAPVLTATTISIDYCRMPIPATLTTSTPTDTIELDSSYKELATLGALARCMESNEDYSEGQSERGNLGPLVTSWIRNEARGGGKTGPVIMRTNRRPGGYRTANQANRDW